MNKAHQLGQEGERLAQNLLSQKNYTILECNWRWQKAEIDIIVKKKDTIVFVEVKTRSSQQFGVPSEFVSVKKQELMMDAAEAYIEQYHENYEIRFDIISIVINSKEKYIEHIENAF